MVRWRIGIVGALLLAGSGLSGQETSWKVEGARTFVVTEIKGEMGAATMTRKAEKGSIVEVRATLSPSTGTASVNIPAIVLAGSSRSGGATSDWNFAAIAVTLETQAGCDYTFPDALVKGSVSQSHPQFGDIKIARDREGEAAVLTVGPRPTTVCLAFPAPSVPEGQMRLRLGKFEVAVPAASK